MSKPVKTPSKMTKNWEISVKNIEESSKMSKNFEKTSQMSIKLEKTVKII